MNRSFDQKTCAAIPVLLLAALQLLACSDKKAIAVERRPLGNATLDRVIDSARLRPAWSRGGSAEDSVLAFPLAMTADEHLVYIVDAGAHRLIAIDSKTGQQTWASTSEGGTTGRLIQPSAVAVVPGGGVAVADQELRLVQFYDQRGRARKVVELPELTPVQSMCVLPDSSLLVGGVPGPSSIARVDSSGHVLAWVALPWKDLEKASHLRVQAWLASDRHGACAIAMVFGRGFAIYDGMRFGTPSEYVEWFDMPGAVITQKKSPGVITTSAHLENRRIAARDAVVLPNEVWIAFQGTSEHAGRVIDRYDRKTGHYLRSTVIRERIESATANDTRLFVTTTENGYPKLAAYDISKP